MRLLLVSNSYAPEPTGIGLYNGSLAEALVARGHEVAVVCAKPSYPHWRLFDGHRGFTWDRTVEHGVEVNRVPLYIPAKVSGAKRIAHYGSFAAAAALPALRVARRFKPDVVFCVVPTMLAAPVALAAARAADACSWLHVQDFEVEAGFATGQMKANGAVARAALAFEYRCIAAFDQTSSISPEMCAKLVEKGRDPATVHEIRNWANIDAVVPMESVASAYRARWNIRTPHVALYSGSIALKQGIGTILDTARLMRERDDITFVICGNGPDRPALEAAARDLPNLQFHDLQPMEQLGDLLGMATIHLLPQKRDAADLVLPSKLTNMLASGRPVVAGAAPGCGLAREVDGCGIAVVPEDASAMAAGIAALIVDPPRHAAASLAARARAEQRWSRDAIIDRLLAAFRDCGGAAVG